MIRFQDEEPTGIYYSQHSDGAAYGWDDENLMKSAGRVSQPQGFCIITSELRSDRQKALRF